MWFLTLHWWYLQLFQVHANATYFYLPLRQTQRPPPSKMLGVMCKGQMTKKPPVIQLWIQMFNSKASRKGFSGRGNFFIVYFLFLWIIFASSPLFVLLAGLLPFSFSSYPERFPLSPHICRRPVLGGCPKNSSLVSAPTHSNASPVIETAWWGQGHWDQSCLGWQEGLRAWGFCMPYTSFSERRAVLGCVEKESLAYLQRETENTEAEEDQTPKSIMKSEDWSILIRSWLLWGRMVVRESFFLKTFFNLHLFAFSFEPDCTCRTECVFKLCWKPAANKGDKGILFLTLHNNREGINNAALKKNPSL